MGEILRNCWEIFNKRPKLTLGLVGVLVIIIVIIMCTGGGKNEPHPTPANTTTTTTTPKPNTNGTDIHPHPWTTYRCYPLASSNNHTDHISCYNMRLNATHPYVKFITNIPADTVKTIFLGGIKDLSGTQMHTLTNDICDAFPNLEEIEGNYLGLEKIMDGALKNCTKLIEIRLSNNSLTEFNTENWTKNKALKTLYLDGNELKDIDNNKLDKTFPGLANIALKRNRITEKRYKELEIAFKADKVTMID